MDQKRETSCTSHPLLYLTCCSSRYKSKGRVHLLLPLFVHCRLSGTSGAPTLNPTQGGQHAGMLACDDFNVLIGVAGCACRLSPLHHPFNDMCACLLCVLGNLFRRVEPVNRKSPKSELVEWCTFRPEFFPGPHFHSSPLSLVGWQRVDSGTVVAYYCLNMYYI